MPVDAASFVFVIALAGVVNGLGIVRWLTGFAEYLKRRSFVQISPYLTFTLTAVFQFLLHILFWWSLWGMRGTATINFISYLYLLSGPIVLYVGTSLLMPSIDEDGIDFKAHYFSVRPSYSTVLILVWLWAIFSSPVLRGSFAPTAPVFGILLANAVAMRATANSTFHGVAAFANWLLFIALVAFYFLEVGSPTAG